MTGHLLEWSWTIAESAFVFAGLSNIQTGTGLTVSGGVSCLVTNLVFSFTTMMGVSKCTVVEGSTMQDHVLLRMTVLGDALSWSEVLLGMAGDQNLWSAMVP